MKAPALVSVIMPVYNAEAFLEEAIESVLSQTWPHWELLLADDGSTDRSPEIARSYVGDRVRVLEHPGRANRGESATRNLGLREARGDLIAFLDADDVWRPAKLERQAPLLIACPEAGMLYGNTEYWSSWNRTGQDFQPDLGVAPGTLAEPPRLLTLYLRREAAVPCTCGLLVRRGVCERVGGFEESFRGMYADQVFYAKMIAAAPVLIADGCWERYRQHPDSCVATARKEGTAREARRAYLEWLDKYLRERGMAGPDLRWALRKELWACRYPRLERTLRPVRRWLSA